MAIAIARVPALAVGMAVVAVALGCWCWYTPVILPDVVVSVGFLNQTSAVVRTVFNGRPHAGMIQVRAQGSSAWDSVPEGLDFGASHTTLTLLTGLIPSTRYEFRRVPEMGISAGSFKTFPGAGSPTSFVFGSCIMTCFMWPLLGLDLDPFVRYVAQTAPDFLLLLGDSIYADVLRESFVTKWRRLWSLRSFQALARALPVFAMYDDHEVRNGWGGPETPGLEPALSSWVSFLGGRTTSSSQVGESHFFDIMPSPGLLDVFILDTRLHRGVDKDYPILGQRQHAALLEWLRRPAGGRVRVVASPAAWSLSQASSLGALLLKDGDGWNMAKAEREHLFDEVQRLQCSGVIPGGVLLLSGDVHYSSVSRLRKGLLEVGSTPIYAFPLPMYQGDVDGGEKVLWSSSSRLHLGRVDVGQVPPIASKHRTCA